MYAQPPIIIHTEQEPEPKCPHCGKDLPGWHGPTMTSMSEVLIALGVVLGACLIVLLLMVSVIDGSLDGKRDSATCEYEVNSIADVAMFPGKTAACIVTRFLYKSRW